MMHKELIRGVEIDFPYEPYDCQKLFMEKVIEALDSHSHAVLESPTGTGKTLSLLCSTLAWLEREKVRLVSSVPAITGGIINASNLVPKVIYATRTHSQLKQVVREINKTRYKYLKVAILASRDQLCIHEKVKKEENSHLKSLMCRNMVKNRKCHHYNMFDRDRDLANEIYKNHSSGEVMDIEDLENISTKLGHCPFYRSRQMNEDADLILLPYNYILDPKVRDAHRIDLKRNILIFDEAHNLVSNCEESVSAELSTKEIALCQKEAKKVLELVIADEERARVEAENSSLTFDQVEKRKGNTKDESQKLNKQDIATLLSLLQNLETAIDNIDLKMEGKSIKDLQGKVFDGIRMIQLLESCGFKRHMRESISLVIDKIGSFLAENASIGSGLWAETGTHLANFASFISKVFVETFEGASDFERPNSILRVADPNIASKSFQLYITKNEHGEITLNYWCFTAGLAMRYLRSRGVHSIILTSGTLTPLDHFISTMGINFHSQLESVHVANNDQVIVGAIRNGFDQKPINGRFEKRAEESYKIRVGELLLKSVESTPQGILAFFPSYKQLHEFIKCWQTATEGGLSLWAKMERHKRLFIEPSKKNEVPLLTIELDNAIANGRGALLFAVCRGKLSEGIDFKDSHCRAVFIVSIPYPPLHQPRVILKKHYLNDQKKHNKKAITGEEWYSTEAIRSVNQAIGRVIRHKDDFGVIILADERYSKMPTQVFPSWIRPNFTVFEFPNSFITRIGTFFKERGILVKQSQINLQRMNVEPLTRKRPSAIPLEYETNTKRNIDDLEELYMQDCNSRKEVDSQVDILVTGPIKSSQSKVTIQSQSCPKLQGTGSIRSVESNNMEKMMNQTMKKKSLKLKANSSISSHFGNNCITLDENIPTEKLIQENDLAIHPCCSNSSSTPTNNIIENLELKQSRIIKKRPLQPSVTPTSNVNSPEIVRSFKSSIQVMPIFTVDEYKKLLDPLPRLIQRNIGKAQKFYLETRNLEEFMQRFSKILLPSYPQVFLGFHSFLHKEHQEAFREFCVTEKLI